MSRKRLQRLIASARKVYLTAPPPERASRPETAPLGFATRVAAQWARPARRRGADLLERLAWWGAAASLVLCLTAFVHRQSLRPPGAFDVFLDAAYPVSQN